MPPRSKRKGEAKVKEMDWCTNDADNMKMNKVNGDKNQISGTALNQFIPSITFLLSFKGKVHVW